MSPHSAHTAAFVPAMKWLFHVLLCMASKSALPSVFRCYLCLPGLGISDQRNDGLPLGVPLFKQICRFTGENLSVLMAPGLRL